MTRALSRVVRGAGLLLLLVVLVAVVVLTRAALDRLPGLDTGPLAFAVRPFLAAAVAFAGLGLRRVSPGPPHSS